ncbi:MAG: hypothetical protein DRN15_02950 [Thermoprotei archaeon]|nr:MAG: hypothetical protein DRN15_02950 [Thermoprotei archaeon]
MYKKLPYDVYFDKVYGGWLGKCIGGAIGAQVEGRKELHNFTEETAFPKEWPPNDDLDLQVLWLHTLQERGIFITSRDLAEEWIEHCWYHFNEYGRFLKNFLRGIEPPVSGWFDNEFFRESMGCVIRSEIWGFICPGNPSLAAWYAEKDGVLDHWREAVWAEQFLAAIESSLFFETDIHRLTDTGLEYVPRDSRLFKLIKLVHECRRKGMSWIEAREEVLKRFGSPDFTSIYHNVGFILIALIWGEYDFGRTMLIALNCGYDTDCTCATAGAILGGILGAKKIPDKWKSPLKDEFVMGFKLPRKSFKISHLAHETCAIGIAISKVLNRNIEIINVPSHVISMVNSIPIEIPSPDVEMFVDYLGMPAIGKGEVKEIGIIVRNHRPHTLHAQLRLEVPSEWHTSSPLKVLLRPDESRMYLFRVSSPRKGVLWERNILRAVLTSADGHVWIKEFGLCGARLWKVLGPFWEGIGYFEDHASINKQYIDESMISSGKELELFSRGWELSAPESKLPLDKVISLEGEYCLYLMYRFTCPEEREVSLVVGASGDIKVWLNSKLLGVGIGKYIWNPVMYWFRAKLLRGENRLVIKYVKRTQHPDLSFDLYVENKDQRPGFSVWQIDMGSILD